MYYDRDDKELQRLARKRLGPQWARRLNNMMDTLIDAEPILHKAGNGNMGSHIGAVAEALRNAIGTRRY